MDVKGLGYMDFRGYLDDKGVKNILGLYGCLGMDDVWGVDEYSYRSCFKEKYPWMLPLPIGS